MVLHTILAIDDEKKFRKKYKDLLKPKKIKVLEAPDALETINVLMRDKSIIELIILDICIPQVDGPGIAQILEEYAPSIPVVVSSLIPINDQKLKIRNAEGYYNKLDKIEGLEKKVLELLGVKE